MLVAKLFLTLYAYESILVVHDIILPKAVVCTFPFFDLEFDVKNLASSSFPLLLPFRFSNLLNICVVVYIR